MNCAHNAQRASSKRTKRPLKLLAASLSRIPRVRRASSWAWRTLQCTAASASSASVSGVATKASGATTSKVRRPAESAAESAGSPAKFSAAFTKVRAEAVLIWQWSLSHAAIESAPSPTERFAAGELGDLAHQGALVHRDGSLVGHHALGQFGRTGVAAPVAAKGPGAHPTGGGWSGGCRSGWGGAGEHGASMRVGCIRARIGGVGGASGGRVRSAPGCDQSACTDLKPAQARSAMRCASRATSSSTGPPLDVLCSMKRRLAPSAMPTTA